MTTESTAAPSAPLNRLAREKSPYLLQHARNPVDWFAWSAEAFEKARRENKPIFLSIGYSTCHWCHVMERESFENERVAAFLNQHFVSIKVDREERPDVDKIYMTFVQATTGQGGWPMSVFLTPELKPFFGGTYFPPEERYGRPGFLQLLEQVHRLWETQRGNLVESAAQVHDQLKRIIHSSSASAGSHPTGEILRRAGQMLKQAYDPRHGGFGGAPKFPQPSLPRFLLRYAARFHDDEAVRMVFHTCDRMAAGGIHDQIGGGFARYSVDAEWLVPHFEKMLYDNAQLTQLYLDAHLAGKTWPADSGHGPAPHPEPYAAIARDILDYVLRDMTHPEGGFYSAEDADSEGHEGKFYCWTLEEVSGLLTPEELAVAARYFGLTPQGNFVDHSHPNPLPGLNVLSVADARLDRHEEQRLAEAVRKLAAVRSKRVRPHLDDKVLVSWNGLMLGAFARAYAVLGNEKYRVAAEKNLKFIQDKLWIAPVSPAQTGILYHRWRDGERDNIQLLEGYSFLLSGVLDLYEATLDPKHLEFAVALAQAMLEKFYDREQGGFWQSVGGAQDLILRVKEDYDGAEPSGNSVAVLALLKLGAMTGNGEFSAASQKSLALFSSRLQQAPQAVPYLLQAADFSLQEPQRVVVAGDPDSAPVRELLRAAHSVYAPNQVILGADGPVDPFSRTLSAGGPAVYLCTGMSCLPPARDAASVRQRLKEGQEHFK